MHCEDTFSLLLLSFIVRTRPPSRFHPFSHLLSDERRQFIRRKVAISAEASYPVVPSASADITQCQSNQPSKFSQFGNHFTPGGQLSPRPFNKGIQQLLAIAERAMHRAPELQKPESHPEDKALPGMRFAPVDLNTLRPNHRHFCAFARILKALQQAASRSLEMFVLAANQTMEMNLTRCPGRKHHRGDFKRRKAVQSPTLFPFIFQSIPKHYDHLLEVRVVLASSLQVRTPT
jgi:hypothetical protein